MGKIKKGNVLAIDDNMDILYALELLLKPHVKSFHSESTPCTIVQLMRENDYDVILLDMNFTKNSLNGVQGFRLLHRILTIDPNACVIFLTAHADIEKSVQAMQSGATDFISKPWDNNVLIYKIKRAITLKEQKLANSNSKIDKKNSSTNTPPLLYQSSCMETVVSNIKKVAPTDANILILGENGTGKELIARSLHNNSNRKNKPFITVDIGSLSESLFENELFGHAKGAYTDAKTDEAGRIEMASGGTLFLDEIGNISLQSQTKLLTVLEKREVNRVGENKSRPIDIRIICATNKAVHSMVAEGTFRQDLLYRINTVEINIPPLCERKEDILLLTNFFKTKFCNKYNRTITSIDKSATDKLLNHIWPGNIRELQHVIERAVIMCETEVLFADDIYIGNTPNTNGEMSFASYNLDDIEKEVIGKVLNENDGNMTKSAQDLGITRTALYRRLKKFEI